MSEWGPPCERCGHPSAYHGTTFCQCMTGSDQKRPCDCSGYARLSVERLASALHGRHPKGHALGECPDDFDPAWWHQEAAAVLAALREQP